MELKVPQRKPHNWVSSLLYKEYVVRLHNGVLLTREINDILKFAGKWMDLENIILSEVTQTQKDMSHVFTHKWFLNIKKSSPQITIPENLDNNEDP